MNREGKLIETLNTMIEHSSPIYMEDFNQVIRCNDNLVAAEKDNDKIGLRLFDNNDLKSGWAISTLSIIATITDVLVDKRLSFIVEDDGRITGVQWYTQQGNE